MLDLSRLSEEQRQAVLAPDGPLLLLAGPGSGKTTLLAARIAYLVLTRQIPPASILALTFASKACRELRARLASLVGDQSVGVEVSTFHAFGLRLVRHWSEELGLGPGPVIVYPEAEARVLLCQVAAELGADLDHLPMAELARRVERWRLNGDSTIQVQGVIQQLAAAYEELLRQRGAVDYPAMLRWPLQLFRQQPRVLRLFQDSYRFVLNDECQDVCTAQYALLRFLALQHRNLLLVGDPLQSLYGWRGADTRVLQTFQEDFPEARILTLTQNFRSTKQIVALANALGRSLPHSRPLWTANAEGAPVRLHQTRDDRAEAALVARKIEQLRREGIVNRWGEIAVLYRTNQQAVALTVALRWRSIPYHVRGRADLFSQQEVRDAIAYLRLAHNPDDGVALARIVNVPPRRLGRLESRLRKHPVPARELPILAQEYGLAARARAEDLVRLIEELHSRSATCSPAQLLDLTLDRTSYRSWLLGHSDGRARVGNLDTLRELALRAEGDLATWLAELQLDGAADVAPDQEERVLLTTIHQSKGSEWRAVFVTGLEEGLLPHARALRSHDDADARGLEDERRVAYVAVTRPREHLALTCCERRGEEGRSRRPSRFLRGLPLVIERAA